MTPSSEELAGAGLVSLWVQKWLQSGSRVFPSPGLHEREIQSLQSLLPTALSSMPVMPVPALCLTSFLSTLTRSSPTKLSSSRTLICKWSDGCVLIRPMQMTYILVDRSIIHFIIPRANLGTHAGKASVTPLSWPPSQYTLKILSFIYMNVYVYMSA